MPKYCKYCGDPIGKDEKFCDNCGRPVAAEAPAEQPTRTGPVEAAPKRVSFPPPAPKRAGSSASAQAAEPKNRKNRKKGKRFASFMLAVLMLAAFVYTGFYKPGFLRKMPAVDGLIDGLNGGSDTPDTVEELLDYMDTMTPEEYSALFGGELEITKENSPGNPCLIKTRWTKKERNKIEEVRAAFTADEPTATGEKAPFKNGRLTVSESDIQGMEIGKQFMESVTRYAKKKGLSMKTAPEGGSKPTSDPGWGDAPIIGPGADGWQRNCPLGGSKSAVRTGVLRPLSR